MADGSTPALALQHLNLNDGSPVQEATRLASEGFGPSMADGSTPALALQQWNLNESLKELDRLDGYKPVRTRHAASTGAPAPYPPVESSTLGATVFGFEQQYFGKGFDPFLLGADRARNEVNLKTLHPPRQALV